MRFYKIKIIALAFCFLSCTAVAGIQIDEMALSDVASVGVQKTLAFTSWGQMPFEVLTQITQELSTQKKSYQLSQMTAEVLGQKTLMEASDLTQKQATEWTVIRIQALLNLGFYQQALSLIDALPRADKSVEVLQIKADAYLLSDDFEGACQVALQNKGKSDYFAKLNIMCLAIGDKKEKALSAFDVWREKNTQELAFTYAMNTFFDLPTARLPPEIKLDVLEVYLFKLLKLPYQVEKAPVACQVIPKTAVVPFQNAVNIEKLIERWTGQGLSSDVQSYKLYLLFAYADLFREDLKLIRKRSLWKQPVTTQNYSAFVLWLSDKPESQITGADLLLSLWILSQHLMGAPKAMLILHKGGFDVEPFVSEQLN